MADSEEPEYENMSIKTFIESFEIIFAKKYMLKYYDEENSSLSITSNSNLFFINVSRTRDILKKEVPKIVRVKPS